MPKDLALPARILMALLIANLGWSRCAAASYPAMAPLSQYQSATEADEIALARSAAPSAISDKADVLVLGQHGYETAINGTNGFACIVERAWANEFDNAEFWNPSMRAPICFNPAAARSVLPPYLERTRWVLQGVSLSEMKARTNTALNANSAMLPESGAMCFMMSSQGHLNDTDGHWHPHLMFFIAHIARSAWGADLPGSPVYASQTDPNPVTTFYVPVAKWSDGTPAMADMR
jgi:hypothetical protein